MISWTDTQTLIQPVTSYTVKFQKKIDSTYISITGVCEGMTDDDCSDGCSCTVPMTTLTSATGWTTNDTTKISV